jgi:hypothetical protein
MSPSSPRSGELGGTAMTMEVALKDPRIILDPRYDWPR